MYQSFIHYLVRFRQYIKFWIALYHPLPAPIHRL